MTCTTLADKTERGLACEASRTVPWAAVLALVLAMILVGARLAHAAPSPAPPAGVGPPLLHDLFTDSMVLQRDVRFPVWGWAPPGAEVTVRFRGRSERTRAGGDGRWQVEMGPFAAGGPFVLEVDGPTRVILKDVLVGDVWICSGQSNMEMGLSMARDGEREIALGHYPRIRLFTVPKRTARTPQARVEGRWSVCTPQSLAQTGTWGGFSAVGYFFGRALHQDLGVPIGLLLTSWGGTPAEAWIEAPVLRRMKDLQPANEMLDLLDLADPEAVSQERMAAWWRSNDPGSSAVPGWESPALDASSWKTMKLPLNWEEAGLPDFDGVVWFRRTVEIPAEWAGHDLSLRLGPIDDRDTTWFAGVKVGGRDDWDAQRDYQVPGRLVVPGKRTIAVRVLDTGGAGGFWGSPSQMELRRADGGGTPVSLAGEWSCRASTPLARAGRLPCRLSSYTTASVHYNGMVAPLVPFGVKGVIWYQGEANAHHAQDYRRVMEALVADWRTRFGQPLPFLVVQLANFGPARAEPARSDWAALREAQWLLTRRVPRTGLVTAVDIGDGADIHPKNKQDVGKRLALAARAIACGEDVAWQGPTYRGLRVEGGRLRVTFEHTGGGLVARGGKLQGFAIAGEDRRFVWADAVIEGDSVVLSSACVARPVAARYAWADNPSCSLYGRHGLPALPFRSDSWKE